MKHLVKENKLADHIFVDSAGTMDYHIGEPADARMRSHASNRGYNLDSIARQFDPDKDFAEFDYIVAMDNENYADLLSFDIKNKYSTKIYRMAQFCEKIGIKEVPDPYYGGPQGFEFVLDILEDGCNGLLEKIRQDIHQ